MSFHWAQWAGSLRTNQDRCMDRPVSLLGRLVVKQARGGGGSARQPAPACLTVTQAVTMLPLEARHLRPELMQFTMASLSGMRVRREL